jgi:dTDP-4-dehydrorhamnose 3,5-epimerase
LLVTHLHPTPIAGVLIAELKAYTDARGRFMETFRREWFPQVSWERVQSNRSESRAGVLRGLHYHFHQVDYWFCAQGRIRAGLVDLRPDSPTFRVVHTVDLDADAPRGLFIPVGVAHGFYAQTDCTLFYTVNNYYDSRDELGVAWDDPALGLDWGVVGQPLISERDMANPRLDDIAPDRLPRVQAPIKP